jgi:hypothetical protein
MPIQPHESELNLKPQIDLLSPLIAYDLEKKSRTHWVALISRTSFKELNDEIRQTHPDIPADKNIFTHKYSTQPLDLSSLLDNNLFLRTSLASLLNRQYTTEYPGNKFIVGRGIRSTWGVDKRDIDINIQRSLNDINFDHPQKGKLDHNTNFAIALRLVVGQDNITNTSQLNAVTPNKPPDYSRLHKGFVDLTDPAFIGQMVNELGLTSQQDLPAYYVKIANWLRDCALQEVKDRSQSKYIFPYPLAITEFTPPLPLLPEIMRVYGEYLNDLPQFIKTGESYNLGQIKIELESLLGTSNQEKDDFIHRILKIHQISDSDFISHFPQALTYQQNIIDIFQLLSTKPQLVHKNEPDLTSPGSIPSIPDFRQEILDHGGRAPLHRTTGFPPRTHDKDPR